MLKTLFSKIVAILIVILLVSSSITGVMLYAFMWNFLSREKEGVLDSAGKYVNANMEVYVNDVSYYAENHNDAFGAIMKGRLDRSLETFLDSYSDYTNAVIWVVNTDAQIWMMAGEDKIPDVMEKIRDAPGRYSLKDPKQYQKVLLGNEGSIKEIGNFYGLFEESEWLTIEKPFIYKGEILGAVYLHTKIPEISKAVTTIFKFFILSVAVAILISIVLVYVFSLRLSRPLKQINNAAKLIANGQFDKRLDIRSEDEIGELAVSFNNMASALQNLEEMRRGFIANVSHELRTPMTSISGFVEGILDGTIPQERQDEYLAIVKDETKRLSRLTSDLLDLARMEAGEVKLNPLNFNINELIRRCIIKLETLITNKDIEIEACFQEEEMYVNADVDSIERVIINLVHNAIKFVPHNGKIVLSTSRYKNKVLVSVEDNGIGIDSSEIGLIWDRFYKSDKSRSKEKGGTGLGLAIVKNIINEHKQEIWVTSELGKGTKFSFTLSTVIEGT